VRTLASADGMSFMERLRACILGGRGNAKGPCHVSAPMSQGRRVRTFAGTLRSISHSRDAFKQALTHRSHV
jgi:hypothetical protein